MDKIDIGQSRGDEEVEDSCETGEESENFGKSAHPPVSRNESESGATEDTTQNQEEYPGLLDRLLAAATVAATVVAEAATAAGTVAVDVAIAGEQEVEKQLEALREVEKKLEALPYSDDPTDGAKEVE